MKCENCSHAEMCRWIDELEGRGCDFCDEKLCELLILKSDILLHQDDKKKWAESIKQEKKNGVIILPPYFTPLLVPNDVEIRIEQEPCEWGRMTFDATSGTSVFEFSDGTIKQVKQAELEQCEDAISREAVMGLVAREHTEWDDLYIDIAKLPSVTQKSGKWIERDKRAHYAYWERYKCSKCGHYGDNDYKFCPNCGAKMESEEQE